MPPSPIISTRPMPATAVMPVVLDVRVVTGTGGGPDKTILNSPRFLEPLGYRNICAYIHPSEDPGFDTLRRKAANWGAPLLSVPDRGPVDWRVLSQLLKICREQRVTIWHGHEYKSNFLGLILRRFWPMRLVTTVHGWVKHTRRTPLYYAIDRACLPRYESVICVSQDLYSLCLKYGVRRGSLRLDRKRDRHPAIPAVPGPWNSQAAALCSSRALCDRGCRTTVTGERV